MIEYRMEQRKPLTIKLEGSSVMPTLIFFRGEQQLYAIRVDRESVREIARRKWFIGHSHPVTYDPTFNRMVPLHRWLMLPHRQGAKCVSFRDEDEANCTFSNMEVITRSLACRNDRPQTRRTGSSATSEPNIQRTPRNKFRVSFSHRMMNIYPPECDTEADAIKVRDYIKFQIEPDLRRKRRKPELPPLLRHRIIKYLRRRLSEIRRNPRCTITPIKNIYLDNPPPNASYRYRFKHEGRIYCKSGFKSIMAAVRAYNCHVFKVTKDAGRKRRLSREYVTRERMRLDALENAGILRNGKSRGICSRSKAQKFLNGNTISNSGHR